MSDVSVITLAGGRPAHLANLVRALDQQTRPPAELVVAVMQGDDYVLPEAGFPVRQIRVRGDGLPLSLARNTAARAAQGERLVFLDMDCIAAPTLIADYEAALDRLDGLLMGEVLYLPAGAADGDWRFDDLRPRGVKHSERAGPPETALEVCADYRCFWSLNFAVRKATFFQAGGFDESFVGYGGEDTDFGKAATLAGTPLAWVRGALALHQHHPHHMPPVHHLDSVVRNAQRFEAKWGYRTMDHWLKAFRLMGLIDDAPGRPIRILRRPDADDLALTGQQSHEPFASSARVLARLQQAGNGAAVTA